MQFPNDIFTVHTTKISQFESGEFLLIVSVR